MLGSLDSVDSEHHPFDEAMCSRSQFHAKRLHFFLWRLDPSGKPVNVASYRGAFLPFHLKYFEFVLFQGI